MTNVIFPRFDFLLASGGVSPLTVARSIKPEEISEPGGLRPPLAKTKATGANDTKICKPSAEFS